MLNAETEALVTEGATAWEGTEGGRHEAAMRAVLRDLPPVDAVALLAEVGAWGVNLHDNDLVPIDATAAGPTNTRRQCHARR